ncbi:hypothetical protein ACIQU5_03515 [Streptomyces sp. NPDC090306]|uniref:hypothetical protein n=1 Tax=unclassified Streptomyces TaxID=2593676 RepID=UPI0036E746E5
MALWVLSGAVSIALSGCSSGNSGEGGEGEGCAWVLSFDSRTYERPWPSTISDRPEVRHTGDALGTGRLKGCDDGPSADQKTRVYRIPGISPAQAVISQENVIGLTDPRHIPAGVRKLLIIPSGDPQSS